MGALVEPIPAAAGALRHGEAGRPGEDVRSDLHVVVTGREEPGLQVEVRSKVAALYERDIHATVVATLEALGVRAARVQVDDKGALPWVIAARVEAAARAAGLVRAGADARPRPIRPETPHSARERLRRSRLYLPGGEPKFMLNAGLHRPDAVIFDLEDSVHPSAKESARLLVRNALRVLDLGAAERTVRINQLPLGLHDLDVIVPEAPDLILIPKVERADQVREVAWRITEIRRAAHQLAGMPPIWLIPIVESALGVENAWDIAVASPTVAALTIGLEDYTADLGVVKTPEGAESEWARRRIVNAARAAGVQPIDSVYGDVADEEGLARWGRASRAMGFVGMGCLHPRQIPIVHRAFAPTPEEIERALRIVTAFREAEARGVSVVSLGSKMIDPPVVARARRLVDLAHELGLVTVEET